ncbi:MAG: serine/threonine protein kinase [Phycisphaerales bacterium]|nr:MAG: serine/threonine protein kinase [Phycisphaerales bacterium]
MDDARRCQSEQLFHKVIDLPADQRQVYLSRHCCEDPLIRAEVESLLAHYDRGPIPLLPELAATDEADHENIGGCVGVYRLQRLIGEGGFGSVYMAEQQAPVRRQVALKIIKLGMDTKQVIARFEAERQALAMMEHPNIARVLDAGATKTGRPYFVMELVRGVQITEYCDQNRLATRQRVELFAQVGRAVQHAHQKGILHRDIKPSNVLITQHDGIAIPKVIDFGVAKATSGRLTDATLLTESLQLVGTPEYMSPEQATISGLDVDTRSDVYSLGVLLYELLTGTTPFRSTDLRGASVDEVRRIIREEDPPTPSHRLSTLGVELTEIARFRRADPQTLGRLIRGDLDWVVMKAMEKDRTRRYESAAAMVADIEAHLNNQPVAAGAPCTSYRLRKFVRRHRIGVLAGTLVTAALVLGSTFAAVGFVRARTERDAANEAAARAEAVNAFLQDVLAAADPMQLRQQSAFATTDQSPPASPGAVGRDILTAEIIRLASAKVEEAFSGRPELEATARETIGMTLRGLGLCDHARAQLSTAFDVRRRLLGEDHPMTLRSALALGDLLLETGRGAEAEPLVRSAYVGMRRLYGDDDAKTLNCASILAAVLSDQGEYEDSDGLFERTLELQRRVLWSTHRDALATIWKWSASLLSQGRLVEAQTLAREVFDTAQRTLPAEDSLNILSKPLMGWCYLEEFRYRSAEVAFRAGLEQCRRILGDEHPFTYTTMHGLARSLHGADSQEGIERLYREALAGLRTTRGRLHTHTLSVTRDFGSWLWYKGAYDEAEELYHMLLTDCTEAYGPADPRTLETMDTLAKRLVDTGKMDTVAELRGEHCARLEETYGRRDARWRQAMLDRAEVLTFVGRIDDARVVAQTLLDALKGIVKEHPDDPSALSDYARVLLSCEPADMRDTAAALLLAERAVELNGANAPHILDTVALAYDRAGDHDRARETQMKSLELLSPEASRDPRYVANLVRYMLHKGDIEAANRLVFEGAEALRKALGEDDPRLPAQLFEAGYSLVDAGHYAMATALLIEALERYRTLFGNEHDEVAHTLVTLGQVYQFAGKCEESVEVFKEAVPLCRRLLGDDHRRLADALMSQGMALKACGQAEAATEAHRGALEIYRNLGIENTPLGLNVKRNLANALTAMGRYDEAMRHTEEVVEAARTLYGGMHPLTIATMHTMGKLLLKHGRLHQAEPVLRECLELSRKRNLPEHMIRYLAQIQISLGRCLMSQGRHEEAEALLLEAYAGMRDTRGEAHSLTLRSLRPLVELYKTWSQVDPGDQWRVRLDAVEAAYAGAQ